MNSLVACTEGFFILTGMVIFLALSERSSVLLSVSWGDRGKDPSR